MHPIHLLRSTDTTSCGRLKFKYQKEIQYTKLNTFPIHALHPIHFQYTNKEWVKSNFTADAEIRVWNYVCNLQFKPEKLGQIQAVHIYGYLRDQRLLSPEGSLVLTTPRE